METYYHLADLPKFQEIGKEVPELAKKNLNIMMPYFQQGSSPKGKKH